MSATSRSWFRLITWTSLTVGVVALVLLGLFYNGLPTYGEKKENGVQAAYGTVTTMMSVHGGDWTMWIDSKPFAFEFEWGTFDVYTKPSIGENIVIAYEWQRLYHEDCLLDEEGDYNRHYYWTPLILDWEIIGGR